MKILIADTYYPKFLASHYSGSARLAALPYADQLQALLSQCFGTADFYSRHLRELGHEAMDVVANCIQLQQMWAREHGIRFNPLTARISPRWQRLPVVGRWLSSSQGLLSILIRQIRAERPDILYLQDLNLIPPEVLESLKDAVRLVVGQIASPLPPERYLVPFDLIITSFPHYVERLRARGIASEYFKIGFDPIVLEKLGEQCKEYACTFVGGISAAHAQGTALLETIARSTDIRFFGYGAKSLSPMSAIRKAHNGEVWGLDMYRTLARSQITLNRHIDVAENYANNMRLFEATGCGAMLITDAKDNLNELFEVGKEVVCYHSPAEAVDLINYYANHPIERDAIACAGQARTLRDHTYRIRMEELILILDRHLKK